MFEIHRLHDGRLVKTEAAPKPVGSEHELQDALAFLKKDGGDVPSFARDFVVNAARDLCIKTRPSRDRARVSDDVKALDEIRRGATELARKIERLSSIAHGLLGLELSESEFGKRFDGMLTWEAFVLFRHLEEGAPRAAKALVGKYGEDHGGRNVSTRRLAYGDPYANFIGRLVDLYLGIHGKDRLSATTASRRGRSCYEFVDAVHKYTIGKPIGRERLFKHLARRRKTRCNPERSFSRPGQGKNLADNLSV